MPVKPSEEEEAYFVRREFERRRQAEEEKLEQLNAEEKRKLKDLHYMHCPKCGNNLIEIDYKGIAIDKCSHCEGVWLDQGELEQISHFEKGKLDKIFLVFRK